METIPGKIRCLTCGKEKASSKCAGCAQNFCFNHLIEHRQELSEQLDEIEVDRNLFRQILDQRATERKEHPLIQQINQWEQHSIQKIRETAEETRQLLLKYTDKHLNEIEEKLHKLTNQLKLSRQEDDIIETDLQKWKEELKQIIQEFTKPSEVTIQQSSTTLITYLDVNIITPLNIPNIPINTKWTQNGITVLGRNGKGNGVNQLSNPWGIYVHDDQTIYVTDQSNHRIVEWKNSATTGQVVVGGNRDNRLNGPANVIVDKENNCIIISDCGNRRVVRWPRQNDTSGETLISNIRCCGLAMDNNGYLYVSDVERHEVRQWKIGETNGIVVAGGNGMGNRLDQFNSPHHIFVDQDYSIYVSDSGNHRVMKWMKGAKEGVIVAGGQGQGNNLTQLSFPYGVIVDQLDTVYVADYSNHRVMRWLKGATQGSVVVGGNGEGGRANRFIFPTDLSFDRQNHLYVVDYHNNRVQKFHINSS